MTTTPIPAAYRLLAALYLDDAAAYGTRFGTRKVFLSTVPGIDLADPECTDVLLTLLRTGCLEFARADLVAAMDPALVAASEWRLDGATQHFLVLPEGR